MNTLSHFLIGVNNAIFVGRVDDPPPTVIANNPTALRAFHSEMTTVSLGEPGILGA
jgi:hypothetical protein